VFGLLEELGSSFCVSFLVIASIFYRLRNTAGLIFSTCRGVGHVHILLAGTTETRLFVEKIRGLFEVALLKFKLWASSAAIVGKIRSCGRMFAWDRIPA
jgi:hypothetical protein